MTAKRFTYCIDEVGMYYYICDNSKRGDDRVIMELDTKFDAIEVCNLLNQLNDENEKLKQFIKKLTTKGTGRIDLASGYSYNVSAVLTDYRRDVE